MIAFFGSIVATCIVFFPLKLSGEWVFFWLTYYCTLCIGIGADSSCPALPDPPCACQNLEGHPDCAPGDLLNPTTYELALYALL